MVLRLLAITLLLSALGGCRACPSARCGLPRTPVVPCRYEQTTGEQLPPDVQVDSFEELLPLPAPTESYHLLDALTCQCQAATHASVANMVELERHWAKIMAECDTPAVAENLHLDRDLLSLHANDLRNTAAAAALTAFYQLAGLEARQHYLRSGLETSRQTVNRIDKILAEGLTLPAEVHRQTVVEHRQALEDQQLQLDLLRIQLNGQLQMLLACPIDETRFYWPQVDWQADLTAVDTEAELALGLAQRTDLRGLGLVRRHLRQRTLPIGRGALQLADPTVGSVAPRAGVLHALHCCGCKQAEVPVRCRQLALFYQHAQQGATAEIKGAVYKIGLQQQHVVAAQQRVEKLAAQLQALQKTRDVNDVSVFALSRVRGQLLQAQATRIEKVVDLKIARVQLRAAQDMLAVACGLSPQLGCEGACDCGAARRAQSRRKLLRVTNG